MNVNTFENMIDALHAPRYTKRRKSAELELRRIIAVDNAARGQAEARKVSLAAYNTNTQGIATTRLSLDASKRLRDALVIDNKPVARLDEGFADGYKLEICPNDTDGDGGCGRRTCSVCHGLSLTRRLGNVSRTERNLDHLEYQRYTVGTTGAARKMEREAAIQQQQKRDAELAKAQLRAAGAEKYGAENWVSRPVDLGSNVFRPVNPRDVSIEERNDQFRRLGLPLPVFVQPDDFPYLMADCSRCKAKFEPWVAICPRCNWSPNYDDAEQRKADAISRERTKEKKRTCFNKFGQVFKAGLCVTYIAEERARDGRYIKTFLKASRVDRIEAALTRDHVRGVDVEKYKLIMENGDGVDPDVATAATRITNKNFSE